MRWVGIGGIFDYAIFLALRERFILQGGGRYNLKGCRTKKKCDSEPRAGKSDEKWV